jgi:hypothetical protein
MGIHTLGCLPLMATLLSAATTRRRQSGLASRECPYCLKAIARACMVRLLGALPLFVRGSTH